MIEPQQVTIYCAAYDGDIRPVAPVAAAGGAAVRTRPDRSDACIWHARKAVFPACAAPALQSRTAADTGCAFLGAPSARRAAKTALSQKQAARRFFFAGRVRISSGLHMFPSLISGAQRKAISSIPARVFPAWTAVLHRPQGRVFPSVPVRGLQLLPLLLDIPSAFAPPPRPKLQSVHCEAGWSFQLNRKSTVFIC